MSQANRKGRGFGGWKVWFNLFLLVAFAGLLGFLLQGKNIAVLNPKGFISQEQYGLLLFTVIVLIAVAVPTVLVLYFMAWRYRESNTKAAYNPGMNHGRFFTFSIWAIPSIFMFVLMVMMYPATHKLEPRKSIASDHHPVTIQVVAMRWKWVFLYPEQGIATVNYVQMPKDTPVVFELTADEAPMSSFWIPNLGGQLYAMTGHVNRLNLMGEKIGDYPGSSAEINGAGFAGMKFTARVSTAENFDLWVQSVKQFSDTLDQARYDSLVKPSQDHPVAYYSSYQNDLYSGVLAKYSGSHAHHDIVSHEGHE